MRRQAAFLIGAVLWALAAGCGGDWDPPAPWLIIGKGAFSPTPDPVMIPSTDNVILQIELTARITSVRVDEIRFHGSGSGNDASGITEARLHRDVSGNGILDPGDDLIGSGATFPTDNGDLLFVDLDETVLQDTTVHWLLVHDVSPAAVDGDSFCVRLDSPDDVRGQGKGRRAGVQLDAVVDACLAVVRPALVLAPGPNPPLSGPVPSCAGNIGILQMQLTADTGDDITIGSVTFEGFGTGDDELEVSGVWLYADRNADGALDAADVLLGGPSRYAADDGDVTFPSLGRTIAGRTGEAWLLVYDLTGWIPPGSLFGARFASGGSLSATASPSGFPVAVSGAPVEGALLTADAPSLISAVAIDVNGNGSMDAGDSLIVGFDRNITFPWQLTADLTFDIVPPVDWGPSGGVMVRLPNYRDVEIQLEVPMSIQPNGIYGADPGSTGINVKPLLTSLTGALGCPVLQRPHLLDVGGTLSPRIRRVDPLDVNGDCALGAQDEVEITFTAPVSIIMSDPNIAFQLPVAGDSFGAGARFAGASLPTDELTVTVVLGTLPTLTVPGTFQPTSLAPGSASGLDVNPQAGAIRDARAPAVPALPWTPAGVDLSSLGPIWSSIGEDQADAEFGCSVSGAGDVNGDGYADVIVGAGEFDISSGEGKAYVFHGGPSGLSVAPDWTASGEGAPGARFGHDVSCAGDVNGDGYDDVIIGAWWFNATNDYAGRAYLYLGGPGGLAPGFAWSSSGDDRRWANFGISVDTAGDVDGDGFDDVVVGAYQSWNPAGGLITGKAFVYLGGPGGLSPGPGWTSTGDHSAGAQFGHSVAHAGDVNGDGFGDVIIGARQYGFCSRCTGKAYLYLGSAAGLATTPAWTSVGDDQVGAEFGVSVGSAGDVDGDGFDDFIVGASNMDTASPDVGKAYLYSGGAGPLSTIATWTAIGDNQGGARLGKAVAAAGDLNLDGFGDVIVGAPSYSTTIGRVGKVYIFLGSASGLSTTPDWSSIGDEQHDSCLGWSVDRTGDVDGDGRAEVIVGATHFDSVASNAGKVYLFSICR